MTLDELEKLEQAATPGEWVAGRVEWPDEPYSTISSLSESSGIRGMIPVAEDAALIVAARNELPFLIARIRELEAENDKLKADAAIVGEIKLQGHEHWGLSLMDGLGKFIEQAATASTPLTTTIRVDFKDVGYPVLYLWATTGDEEPAARCNKLAKARDAAQAGMAARDERIRELVAENDRLKAIVAKLPTTADGVPVVLGMVLYETVGPMANGAPVCGFHLVRDGRTELYFHERDFEVELPNVYSTRAAAEAAKEKE